MEHDEMSRTKKAESNSGEKYRSTVETRSRGVAPCFNCISCTSLPNLILLSLFATLHYSPHNCNLDKVRVATRWRIALVPGIVALLAILLVLLPSPLDDPQTFMFQDAPELEGPLQVNTKLQRCRLIFENETVGPESFTADDQGNIYTGLGDGRIVRITASHGQVQLVARTGQDHSKCGQESMEPLCGRPNGIRIDPEGNLVVADAYKGLLRVLLPSGKVQVLIPPEQGVEGVPFKFLNGLEVSTRTGVIYFTESSTKWERRYHRYDILELNSLGRLMVYDPSDKSSKVLMRGLYFANGLALSPEESYLLISELSICRVMKYYLTSSKQGQSEVFVDNLPGYPDNIRINRKGNYYIGLSYARFAGSSLYLFLDYLGPFPTARAFFAKIWPISWYDVFLPKHSIVIEVDKKGTIVASLHDPAAKVISTITDVFEHGRHLYIGSFEAPFVALLDSSRV